MKIIEYLVLSVGIAAAGWFIGDGIITFRRLDQTVDVRGLDERLVEATEGTLDIRFVVSGETLKEVSSQVLQTQKILEEFFERHGFSGSPVQKITMSVTDNHQNGFNLNQKITLPHYTARAGATVTSAEINKIQLLSQSTDELISSGVIIESSVPRYEFKDLNQIKPQMLIAATKSAREAAESFSRDSGSALGKIKSAVQGQFTITSPGAEYDEPSSLQKKVRVVTRITYYLD